MAESVRSRRRQASPFYLKISSLLVKASPSALSFGEHIPPFCNPPINHVPPTLQNPHFPFAHPANVSNLAPATFPFTCIQRHPPPTTTPISTCWNHPALIAFASRASNDPSILGLNTYTIQTTLGRASSQGNQCFSGKGSYNEITQIQRLPNGLPSDGIPPRIC